MTEYQEFLKSKHAKISITGFDVMPEAVNSKLFLFQRDIVRWGCKLGKAAIFAECGLGKTAMQLEWSRLVCDHTQGKVIILAPLAVADQTEREGDKFGIPAKHARTPAEIGDHKIIITNYERLHLFIEAISEDVFVGVVLDESSILKNFSGKTKKQLVETFKRLPYKLACTATPAPNDQLELGNHSEFLDIMPGNEMIARWFINDTQHAGVYRLKGHAEADFWKWLTSWAVCLSRPGDLGPAYDMPEFELPTLNIQQHILPAPQVSIDRAQSQGMLFPDMSPSSTGLHTVKRESLDSRIEQVKTIVSHVNSEDPVVIWCDTNYEADALRIAFPDALEVRGSHTNDLKEQRLRAFSAGENRMIITKPDIAGFGLNWQHCHEMIYAGVGFSFEKLYQSIKRMYRYGQTRPVNVHLIYAETEGGVKAALTAKQEAFTVMQEKMNLAMKAHGLFRNGDKVNLHSVEIQKHTGDLWTLYQGDCVPVVEQELKSDSVDFSVYSPPFPGMFIYSGAEADMGNSEDTDQFMKHYEYLVKDLYRVTRPGRLTAVHCKDIPLYKNADGWFGIEDFSGFIRDCHLKSGWVFHSRITIWKDPVTEMQKTNSHGLLHKNFVQRAQVCRTGLPDYLMVFVKPDPSEQGTPVIQYRQPGDYIGQNAPEPADYAFDTRPAPEYYQGEGVNYNYSIAVWQRYASPVWFDIDQQRVLNTAIARSNEDEKHMAPLQLDVIDRAIDLWTNKGELVLSPFAGVGSEGVESIKLGRRFVGVELKPEYAKWGIANLKEAEIIAQSPRMFE